ncbi:hypothetical protein Noda2021_03090 [Candidatus Dependentiae bacterium Noda2021]|nr:hypothetical protein Noda2021_03090 [Candidatus Dependentiae bacterium Noda2021]
MKKTYLLGTLLFCLNDQAQERKPYVPQVNPEMVVQETEDTPRAKDPLKGWNFELVNRTKEKLSIIVSQGGQPITLAVIPAKTFSIAPYNTPKFRAILPTLNKITTLEITSNTLGRTYFFSADKNIFITLEDGFIRPQTGHYSLRKNGQATESGIPLVNNVTQRDIEGNPEIPVEPSLWDDVDPYDNEYNHGVFGDQ